MILIRKRVQKQVLKCLVLEKKMEMLRRVKDY